MAAWIIDGHCDSIGEYANGERVLLGAEGEKGQWDIKRAGAGNIRLQFMASYIEANYKPYRAMERGLQLLDASWRFAQENTDAVFLVLTKEDVRQLPHPEKLGLLLSVEGGEILDGQLFMLDIIYRLGVRALGLTWNQRNALADGVDEEETGGRLTRFGRQVIRRMNTLGMLIDVSHLNQAGFWQVLEISDRPVIASHSCAQALCPHRRNLTDDQLRALAVKRGVAGVNFAPAFLVAEGAARLHDVIRHIQHMADIAGVEVIGLGSDFDGIPEGPEGLEHAGCYPQLIEALSKAGFASREISQITHENFQRVLLETL
ncbi:MAG: dipeptidase [Peptococcaceae bacterium]|jgi:membrane dipeptidase|nr:dipeptidase [Peptococcaceae bacterium]